jgi:hypothetical protein
MTARFIRPVRGKAAPRAAAAMLLRVPGRPGERPGQADGPGAPDQVNTDDFPEISHDQS